MRGSGEICKIGFGLLRNPNKVAGKSKTAVPRGDFASAFTISLYPLQPRRKVCSDFVTNILKQN